MANNEDLKSRVILLEDEIKRLTSPPFPAATVLGIGKSRIKIAVDGSGVLEVSADDGMRNKMKIGERVVVNQKSMAICGYSEFPAPTGEVVSVDEVVGDQVRIQYKGENKLVVNAVKEVRAGDEVILDASGHIVLKHLPRRKTKYNLETVPNAPWSNIGGLEQTIQQIKDEVEQPFLNSEVFERYGRGPAKGILLYGPPGCGKTLIAKSIAYNLAQLSKQQGKGDGNGHFISVKGPELLNMYLGNSEENIRKIYAAAREMANGVPIVVFIDEAESLLKTRGTGISSDISDTVVPQFLAEMDGMNENENIITVLATNREDIIDPAVLRDGRVDRRIKVVRPDEKGAKEIFGLYLKNKPVQGADQNKARASLMEYAVSRIYDPQNVIYNVVAQREGVLGNFTGRNLVSGAMIKGIVDRACGYAIKREIAGGKKGLSTEDMALALTEEFREHKGFAQAFTKDDWADVFGENGRQYMDMCRHGYVQLQSPKAAKPQTQKLKGGNA